MLPVLDLYYAIPSVQYRSCTKYPNGRSESRRSRESTTSTVNRHLCGVRKIPAKRLLLLLIVVLYCCCRARQTRAPSSYWHTINDSRRRTPSKNKRDFSYALLCYTLSPCPLLTAHFSPSTCKYTRKKISSLDSCHTAAVPTADC